MEVDDVRLIAVVEHRYSSLQVEVVVDSLAEAVALEASAEEAAVAEALAVDSRLTLT